MMKAIKTVSFVRFALLFIAFPCGALNINPNDYSQIRVTKPDGILLHRGANSSMFARLPKKTMVKVLQITNTNWLKVGSENSAGWIVKKYMDKVVQVPSGNGPAFPEGAQESQIWQSQSADCCASAVNAGARPPRNPDETIRLVTWNIRWFPQVTIYGNSQNKYTDQAWLSCPWPGSMPMLLQFKRFLTTPRHGKPCKTFSTARKDKTGATGKSIFKSAVYLKMPMR